jgi:predicted transcriptional regulator
MKRIEMIGIRATEKMKAELEELAEADNRALSSYIVLALQKHLDSLHAEQNAAEADEASGSSGEDG